MKLVELKSHDCHVLMQQLLPIAIRSILHEKVRCAITRLCFFFNSICNKVINKNDLQSLEEEVVITMCQLEMYFPPSFFDISVHLIIHLVREIFYLGPVYLRYQYPFERCMKTYKDYVSNMQYPEGCIAERVVIEEALAFCYDILADVERVGLPNHMIVLK